MKNRQVHFILSRACEKFAGSPALKEGEKTLTYKEYNAEVEDVMISLLASGIHSGNFVAIIMPAGINYALIFMALWKLGAIAIPINPSFPISTILDLLKKLDIQYLLINDEAKYNSLLHRIKHKHSYCEVILYSQLGKSGNKNNKLSKSEEAIKHDLHKPTISEEQFNKPAAIIFSSGSSASPKAIVHSQKNYYYSAMGSNMNIPFRQGDKWLCSLPMYHVSGLSLLWRAAFSGGAVVFPMQLSLMEAVEKISFSHISLVATQAINLMESPALLKVLQKSKCILLGGSAIPEKLLSKGRDLSIPFYSSYGSTELSSQVYTKNPRTATKKKGGLLSFRKIKFSPNKEILLGGSTLFLGYYKEGKIISATNEQGYFASGDLGYLDDKNELQIIGRLDNMFISAGENIQPEEIELVLHKLEFISQSIVVSIDDKKYGKRPVAFIQLNKQLNKNKEKELVWDEIVEKIRELLLKSLPKFKIPDYFFLLDNKDNVQLKQQGIDYKLELKAKMLQTDKKLELKINRKYYERLAKQLI